MRVWVISELYHPEQTSTGHFLTHIAEALSSDYDVAALVARPTYAARGHHVPWRERKGGVDVIRCWSTRFDKNRIAGRAVNALTITLSFVCNALRRFRRGDIALFVTNPPTIPFAMLPACRLRRVTPLLLIHDVYPHVLVGAGIIRPGSAIERILLRFSRWLYTGVRRVVTIGRDMTRVVSELTNGAAQVVMIPNWADLEEIRSMPRTANRIRTSIGATEKFVVEYAGNMGRTHGIEVLVEAAHRLRDLHDIHFVFAGSGAKRAWLESATAGEPNVTILPRQDRADLNELLGAADLSVITLVPGMSGISVPSRMYNVMASGRPILALADRDSELASVIADEAIGWTVSPGDCDRLVERIRYAAEHRAELQAMGEKARSAAESKYSLSRIGAQYRQLIAAVVADRHE